MPQLAGGGDIAAAISRSGSSRAIDDVFLSHSGGQSNPTYVQRHISIHPSIPNKTHDPNQSSPPLMFHNKRPQHHAHASWHFLDNSFQTRKPPYSSLPTHHPTYIRRNRYRSVTRSPSTSTRNPLPSPLLPRRTQLRAQPAQRHRLRRGVVVQCME